LVKYYPRFFKNSSYPKNVKEVHAVAKRKTAVAFNGTAEQEKQLRQIIEEHKNMQGALMPILQQAQELYGYLPIEVQSIIAAELNIPLEEVYGVVTFYAQFTLNPKGKFTVSVCMGTACYVKGSGDVLDKLQQKLGIEAGGITPDGKFSLDVTRCIGACGLAPVMTINETVYGKVTADEVDKILASYL
jgi:NADP-reducing hydrogenase subunit HndA